MKNLLSLLILAWIFLPAAFTCADTKNPNTDWFREARFGAFMHVLPGSDRDLEQAGRYDVETLAKQLESAHAKFFVLTLGQNSGYFVSPNAAYDRRTGRAAGERCSKRDLPLDLFAALQPRGIRLMLYLPCQAPNQDPAAQRAFGLPEGPSDQPITTAFARQWAEVIQEWSDRYGDKVAGWWFDGGYDHVHFNESIASVYAAAVKHGNPKAIVTFNPGVKVVRHTQAEDYTAGELNEPLSVIPASRWLDGSQWHALTYVGSQWGQRDVRFSNKQWAEWARSVAAREGVVTLDVGPNWDATKGPIGSIAPEQLAQLQAVGAALSGTAREAAATPRRLKRAESFFGIHFDFHAGPDCNEIGKNTTPEMVEKILESAHPDYIQVDCKGHPGLTSYPTRAGNQAPGFVGDPLRIFRRVTAEHGVALYMHYSGVWDSEAIRRHPGWGATDASGKVSGNATSFFSPYSDELLIPQLRELAGDYGVDGAWVDGECWASVPDYGTAALKAFALATGIDNVPRKPGDPHWFDFLQFHREAFRNHLRHYVREVKKTHPDMQLCSNWAFTDHMPEQISAPVDWISGDFSPEDSVNSARFSARYMAQQGKPWDLMAWGFTLTGETRNGSRHKSAVQLEREAAVVMAQGGGFQSYYNQRRDGSVPLEHLPVIGEVARFCRARQPFCQGSTPVPQIAFLYSTASHYRETQSLFGRDLSRLNGTLQALAESRQVVDIVGEHHLAGRMANYPLIVVGECEHLEPAFKDELIHHVEKGGCLLLVGPAAASMFAKQLDVTPDGAATSEPRQLAWNTGWSATKDPSQAVKPGVTASVFGKLHPSQDSNSPSQPAATITPLGLGRIAAIHFSFSRGYLEGHSQVMRDFLGGLIQQLFPEPMVQIDGAPTLDVSLNRIAGKLAIHLVNTSGEHWSRKAPLMDVIPPVGPVVLSLRTAKSPTKITLQPGGQSLPFEHQGGVARFTLPTVEIHQIVVVE